MSRTKLAIMNSISGSSMFAIRMLITFFTRALFIQKLGIELLGIQSVFTNILSVLSLAELGFGSSLSLVLFKPLAEKDFKTVSSLMNLFRKIYIYVGIAVLALGLLIFPFLPYLGNEFKLSKIGIYYLLFLTNSVISYFFTYKRTLLNANQRGYIASVNDIIFWLIVQTLQIIVLVTINDYTLFLIIQIIGTLSSNISISKIVGKHFPEYINSSMDSEVPVRLVEEVKKNTIGSMSAKIGSIVVTSTDNLLISTFVSISAAGKFSNYSLIISSGLQALLSNLLYGLTPSIGNYLNSKNNLSVNLLYKRISFYSFFLLIICVPALIIVTPTFITLWVGSDLLLPFSVLACLVANFCISINRLVAVSFINAYGLAWHARKRPIYEAFGNLFLSVFFLKVLNQGILGVVLGTFISSLFIGFWYELRVLALFGLKTKSKSLLTYNLIFLIKLMLVGLFSYMVGNLITLRSVLGLFVSIVLAIIVSGLSFIFLSNKDQKNDIYDRLKKILGRFRM